MSSKRRGKMERLTMLRSQVCKIVTVVIGFLSFAVAADVKIGENLIYNGRFDGDQVMFPDGWVSQPAALPTPKWRQSGGPGGIPSIILDIDPNVETILRRIGHLNSQA